MRQFREQSAETRQKMADAKKGKQMPEETKRKISHSMVSYWQGVPSRQQYRCALLGEGGK